MQYFRIGAAFVIVFSRVQYVEALLNTCFGRSGVQNTEFFACQPDATESTCCLAGDICYTNGLCAPGPTENGTILTPFFVHGCTDPSFTAPACVPNCYSSGGAGLTVCPAAGPDYFCCYGLNGCNCSDPSQVFSLAPGTVVTTIDPSATFTASSSTTSTSLTSSSTSVPSSFTSGSTTSSAIASTSVSASSGIPAAATSPPTSPSNSSSAVTTSSKSNNGVAIGVGVGVGLLVAIAIVGLGLFFLRRKKLSLERAELPVENKPLPAFREYYNPEQMGSELPGQAKLSPSELSASEPSHELPGHQWQ